MYPSLYCLRYVDLFYFCDGRGDFCADWRFRSTGGLAPHKIMTDVRIWHLFQTLKSNVFFYDFYIAQGVQLKTQIKMEY